MQSNRQIYKIKIIKTNHFSENIMDTERRYTVTFWKSDFAGDNLEQLTAIMQQNATSGNGYWFINKTNFIQANMTEPEYEWIMNHVANFGNTEINK